MAEYLLLSHSELESLHNATLRILSETGVALTSPLGREILCRSGGRIHGDRVLIPPELVETALAECPQQVRIRGRGGTVKVLGDGSLNWHNLGGAREIYDHRSGKRRPAVIQDICDATRLLDALEGATTITPFFTPTDAPGPLMSLMMYRHALPNTIKPLQGPGVQTAAEVRISARLAEVIGPPQEVLSLSVSPVSPLGFPDGLVEAILEVARLGIAFGPLPCPTAGTTAPLSIAGAVAQQNAEVLAATVLAQLVHPGLPIIYCGRLAMMEPRTGISVWGGVELGLASAATVQIAHRYGLPVNVYGFSTNSHTLDIQSGFERALNAAIPALAGADELSGIGEMEAGVMGSFAQIVVDSEIALSIRRLRRGIAADSDALAVEVVAAVMDRERSFLASPHTRKYLKNGEIQLTRLAERRSWESWSNDDRQGMAERAQAEAEKILTSHQPPPLAPEQERELEAIMIHAAKELA